MVIMLNNPYQLREVDTDTFLSLFRVNWQQGEHVGLIGPTGTGKSRLASSLLDLREWVVVLAVKREDDTLIRFKEGEKYGHAHYRVIRKWPPEYNWQRIILWEKPKSLEGRDLSRQALSIHRTLSSIYLAGGWCVYFDEAGYIAGVLGLGSDLGILLNQGRSSHISVVASMTRPTSMVARVPKESLNQIRHVVIFKYGNQDESDACAKIAGVSKGKMWEIMQLLRFHPARNGGRFSDFAYIREDEILIVRQKE